MNFLAPLHSGGTVINYRNRPSVSGDLVSITGNEAQGESIYAIVKVKPPQDYVTYIDGSDSEISGGYYYRVGQVTRVWLGFNPDIVGWRVELTKDKVETFLNANENQGTWALHQPGNLSPSDLGIPPAAEAIDQTFNELSDPALSSTTGAYGLSWDYDTSSNFKPSIKLWYPGNADENGVGNGGTTTLQDSNGDIGAAFIAQVKALKRKLTDGIVELGFDTLDLEMPPRSYNYGADFFTTGGIRSAALRRAGKWNITLGGQNTTIDGPGVLTGLSDVAQAQDNRVFKYYRNNVGHIQGVRFMENYYSIPTIDLSGPVSDYVNHILEIDAESTLDSNTAILAAVNGLSALVGVIANSKPVAAGAVESDASEAEAAGEAESGDKEGAGEAESGDKEGAGEAESGAKEGAGEAESGAKEGAGEAESGAKEAAGDAEKAASKFDVGAVSNVLNGGLGPLIPPEYQSTLGFALAASLGLTSIKTAYQRKLQLNGVSGALVKSTVSDVSYSYKTAQGFTSMPDLSTFTVSSSTLFNGASITDFGVNRKRSATPIQVTYLGPRDALSEGLDYVSGGFYVRTA